MAEQVSKEDCLYRLRHSVSHIMAQAVLERFPKGKIAIGPPIEDGFYYDFELPRPLTPEDLEEIEARMREIVAADHDFVYQEMDKEEARQVFAGQPYKLELIEGILSAGMDEYGEPLEETPRLSVYRSGPFVDLCRGPHVGSTREIDPAAIKLLNVAGAYWRGDEQRPMLQRIYGTAWETAEQLEQYLWRREEAARRDHRRLGRELDLFSIQEVGGPGLICWHPKGARIRKIIEDFWYQEHERHGYEIVYTPHIGKADLWAISGHLGFFREGMYAPMNVDEQEYFIKPMNCPYQMLIYKSRTRSYRELPLRWGELGTVYRYERSGTLHGLLRVRGFTIDDAHIICRPDQVEDEIMEVYDFSLNLLRAFGFDEFDVYLSTRPPKAIGTLERWGQAQDALRRALEAQGLPFAMDEGGGAFYGPKIDIKLRDGLGRAWQATTIQFDFNLPERFEMTYVGQDGQEHQPYVVHRALLGALERFLGTLIEHYAGAFPVWLSPVQVTLIPIADRHISYVRSLAERFRKAGLRVEIDNSGERMQAKIRRAQLQKVPYMLIVGDRELRDGTVAVRLRTEEDLGAMKVEDFVVRVERVVEAKKEL